LYHIQGYKTRYYLPRVPVLCAVVGSNPFQAIAKTLVYGGNNETWTRNAIILRCTYYYHVKS